MSNQSTSSASHQWWGEATIPENSTAHWRLGTFHLWASNLPHEWRLTYKRSDDEDENCVQTNTLEDPTPDIPGATVVRFGESYDHDQLLLRPAVADRIVVSHPYQEFYVAPRDSATLYVSSPVWLQVQTTQPPRRLLDVPVYRPSDTWLGANTREGELAYASKTSARVRLENVPWRPGRVITPVKIVNEADDTFLVQRIALPIPNLALYATSDGRLWTQSVSLHRSANDPLARCQISEGSAGLPSGAAFLSEPRTPGGKNLILRAFSGLLR